jgi:hypothetical protein
MTLVSAEMPEVEPCERRCENAWRLVEESFSLSGIASSKRYNITLDTRNGFMLAALKGDYRKRE